MEILHHTHGKFYVKTRNGEAELMYDIDGNVMRIFHTYVPESERGKGLAGELAVAAFEFAKGNKLKVKPDCSYIQHFMEKHKEMKKYSV